MRCEIAGLILDMRGKKDEAYLKTQEGEEVMKENS
jgi:hypothetical protein